MSISPDPGRSLPQDQPPQGPPPPPQQPPYYPPQQYLPQEPAKPISAAGWFGPAVLFVQALTLGALAWVANDLGNTRQLLQHQLVELKEKHDATRSRVDVLDERAGRLKQELGETATRAAQLGNRLGATQKEVTETKKETQQLAAQTQQAAQQLGSQISAVQQEANTKLAGVNTEVGGVKTDLSATKKDLEATKAQLKSTIGDLGVQSGLVARNHDEIGELKRRGERNYFEFSLSKEKTPKRVGDISVRLTRTDQKKLRYTIEVVADDKPIEKKDRTLNEPVQFYVARARIPYEIVVNEIGKDRIVGYLATPK